jgi:tetratricopeptide (TPR) repeat protein
MSFDKNKAMRNAERFLSQGKIRGAINEYQRVVENDPRDYSTLNILGDLHAKNQDTQQAVGCFTQVAEYYNTQGFSHKAIAVYNKIARIEPGSMEVSAKLAQLYQSKGSVAEARIHYTKLAEHYQKKGQKIEALGIWKQIAELDPNNTEIYLKIAETCWQEEQFDEATRAFTEAGLRFLKQEKFESALTAFSRALEIKKNDLRALKGLVKAQIGLGCADEAANSLEEVLAEQPHNRDILYLLVDCYLDMDNPAQAERAIIKLVEQEPANYPKFLELVKIYLKKGDLDARPAYFQYRPNICWSADNPRNFSNGQMRF